MKWWVIFTILLLGVGFVLVMTGCEGCGTEEERTRPGADDDDADDDDDDTGDDDDTIPPGAIVDTDGSVGKYCSLEIEEDNYFISYHHKTNGLKFAHYDGENWNIEVVDSGENVGLYTSLKVKNGKYHISYYAQGKLKYAKNTGSGWEIEVVDSSSSDVGKYSKLVLDENDRPMIAYYDAANADVKFARYDGTMWQIEAVDTQGDVGRFVELAYYQPLVFLFYYDYTNGDLKFAYRTPTNWQVKIVYSEGDVGTWPSAYVTPMGHIHLAFQDETNQDLMYGYLDDVSTNWLIERVDEDGFVGANANILSKDGKPLIIYHDQDNNDVKQAFKASKGWNFTSLLSDGSFGFWISAELDKFGNVHFCHYYVVKEDLLIWPPIED